MEVSTLWWLATGAAVAVELATGTFYLLMFALGLAAAALATHAGLGISTQFVVAAVVGGGSVAGWHLRQTRKPAAPRAEANKDVNMDIGETIHIAHWDTDGTASVKYRGAQWAVLHRESAPPSTGTHRVVEVVGNRLVVEKI